jgi:hypothetical protein
VKYLFLSVIVAAIVVPLAFSSDPRPRRGLKRAILAVFTFNLLYLVALYLTHKASYP